MKNSDQKNSSISGDSIRANVERVIGSQRSTLEALTTASPVKIPAEPHEQFRLVLSTLFESRDCVEVIAATPSADGKSAPLGNRLRHSAANWGQLSSADLDVQLGFRCGTYMRINPVEGSRPGSGHNGCTTDADVATHRYCLIEHDHLPRDLQATLLSTLPLPIAAIVDSGGQSLHAWIKIAASWGGQFHEEVKPLYGYLATLGFDTSNKNPSRLTRAPGFLRTDDPSTPQQQSLLYLNPAPANTPIINLTELK